MRQDSRLLKLFVGSALAFCQVGQAQTSPPPSGKTYTCAQGTDKARGNVSVAISNGSNLMRGFANTEKGRVKEIGGVITGVQAPVKTHASSQMEAELAALNIAYGTYQQMQILQSQAQGLSGGLFMPLQGGMGMGMGMGGGYIGNTYYSQSTNPYKSKGQKSGNYVPQNNATNGAALERRAGDIAGDKYNSADENFQDRPGDIAAASSIGASEYRAGEEVEDRPGDQVDSRYGERVGPRAGNDVPQRHKTAPETERTPVNAYQAALKKAFGLGEEGGGLQDKRNAGTKAGSLELRPGDKVPPSVGSSHGQLGNISFGAQVDDSGNIRYVRYQFGQMPAVFIDANNKKSVSQDPYFAKIQSYLENFKTFAACCKDDSKSGCSLADKPELSALLKAPSAEKPKSTESFFNKNPFNTAPAGGVK